MWRGPRRRVELTVDLRVYHRHLVPGVTGALIPEHKRSIWGNSDRFGAVQFDCCGKTLDVVIDQLTFLPEDE